MNKNIKKKNIAVIGGGASGMMAAITASLNRGRPHILLFERNDRVGKKILATGNGKCNFSNLRMKEECYYGGNSRIIQDFISRFNPADTVEFFRGLGMLVKNRNGYLYPATDQASTVLDVLRIQMRELGIEIITGHKVTDIRKENEKFTVIAGGQTYTADSVILATGGQAAPRTGSDGEGFRLARQLGHSVTECVPALVQLRCGQNELKAVAGVRQDAEISLFTDGKIRASERGELQLTDYGLSGIVIFQLSRIASYACRRKQKVQVVADLLPDYGEQELELLKTQRKLLFRGRNAEEFFTGILNKKLVLYFLKQIGLKTGQMMEEVPDQKIDEFFSLCKAWKLPVTGTNSFEQAQVSAGGIPWNEVSGDLESRKVPGLFFAGEIMDVDGKCGGYNLQWAWTSGYIAGKSAGESEC